jgi:hypothetical protein
MFPLKCSDAGNRSIKSDMATKMDSIRLRRLGAYRFSMFLEDASPENVILSNYKTEIVPFCFEILSMVLAPFFLRFMNA